LPARNVAAILRGRSQIDYPRDTVLAGSPFNPIGIRKKLNLRSRNKRGPLCVCVDNLIQYA